MFWLALTRKDDEEVEIFGATDSFHFEAGGRRQKRRGGLPQVAELLATIADETDTRIPPLARTSLESLARRFLLLHEEILAAEKHIHAWHRSNAASRRLETVPGIGAITASALAATVTDPALFKSGREHSPKMKLVMK